MSDEPTDHPHSKAETGEPYDNGVRVVHTVTNEMGVVRDYWPYNYGPGKRSTTFPWCYEVDFTLRGRGLPAAPRAWPGGCWPADICLAR